MTTKEESAKQTRIKKQAFTDRQIDEKDTMIEINQSLKGITWDDSDVPTLTSQAAEKSVTEDKESYSFDIIEDFLPETETLYGHKPDCTCIKCQPKKAFNTASPLASIPVEKGIQPLSKKRFK